jgi:hypothetical protein
MTQNRNRNVHTRVHTRVGKQKEGLYPLNAPQRVSEIWLQVFTVSCFAVNKRAQKKGESQTHRELKAHGRGGEK